MRDFLTALASDKKDVYGCFLWILVKEISFGLSCLNQLMQFVRINHTSKTSLSYILFGLSHLNQLMQQVPFSILVQNFKLCTNYGNKFPTQVRL
jgi:hypothetical protein